MSEKSMVPSRFIFCVIVVSMFLLVLSSIFLLQFRDRSFIPRSVFELILVNNTPFYSNANIKREENTLSPFPSGDKKTQAQTPGESDCQIFKSAQKLSSIEQQRILACDPTGALLRVFMYDLPPEFHFAILGWKGSENQTWPQVNDPKRVPSYPGGLNLQHSPEYWLTLDLLSSNSEEVVRPCAAVRVQNSSQADVIFVPFFSSLSYNRLSKIQGDEKVSTNEMLQEKLVQFLMSREEWKRSGGKDHLIVAHHPNSMLVARRKIGSAILVLADFGRYPVEVANVKKDIIAPYKHVVRTLPRAESFSYKERPTLLYFQGAIYRKDGGIIRQELYYLLKNEKDVHFASGTVRRNGVREASHGMALSKFCLNIAGDTPSSNRLFDSIASHCVPVIISDNIELPFEDMLDYSDFCLFVRAKDAVRKGYLLNLLTSVTQKRWTGMWERLKEIALHFEYQYPSQPGDAVNMIWQEVTHKVSSARFDLHRKNRYKKSQLIFRTD